MLVTAPMSLGLFQIFIGARGLKNKPKQTNPTATTEQKCILLVSRGLVFTAFWYPARPAPMYCSHASPSLQRAFYKPSVCGCLGFWFLSLSNLTISHQRKVLAHTSSLVSARRAADLSDFWSI